MTVNEGKGSKRREEERRTIFVAGVEDYTGDDSVVDGLLERGFEVVGGCHGECVFVEYCFLACGMYQR